jgi:carboxyl-terminal processing protease
MMKLNLKLYFAGTALAVFCACFPAPLFADAKQPENHIPDTEDDAYKTISLFMNVLQMLRQHYVDPEKVTYDKLMKGAMKGMLHELDPFSVYETPEHYKHTVEGTKGAFGGIGVVITTKNRVLEVVAPMEDTPGFKAGIQAGDIITEIDGESTKGMNMADCVKRLKGQPGTKVTLTVYRRSEDVNKDITIERAIIKVSPVKGTKIMEDNIGYIRISQFSAPAAGKLDEALEKLKGKKMKALVLDLRGNPGGLLTSAIEVCSRFLGEGEVIVSTQGRDKKDRREYRSLTCDKALDIPMAVLVNGSSASASEIVSGCLKDHKRAVLIGERTFGKAFIQTIIPLNNNNGAVRFTTGKYYTPDGNLIHGSGIEPDISIPVSIGSEAKLSRQRALFPGQIQPKSKGCIRDVQLQRAVEILKGICLFGEVKNGD